MLTQEKLQAVTQQIRKDLPELREFSEGCLIKFTDGKELRIVEFVSNLCILYDGSEVHKIRKQDFPKYFEIIGHEPMLDDILEWFEMMRQLPEDTFFQDVFFQTNNGKYLEIYGDGGLLAKWDLSEPYLKDQSEELINFLYNLITK